MRAVILAGGLGSRLKPFTDAIPKPLLPIGEKSILEVQISKLKAHGFTHVYLATNYKSEYIESFFGSGERLGVKLTISKEERPLGTCGPLTLLQSELTEPFLVMNGDILTTLNFGRFYEHALALDADLCVGTKEIMTPFQFGRIVADGSYITAVEEKPDIKTEIVAGLYILKPAIFRHIPEQEYFGMDDLIRALLVAKAPVARYQIGEYWLDIGRIEDYETAEEAYREHFED